MGQEKIYIDIAPELRELLDSNNVQPERAIAAELEKQGVEATVDWDRNPTSAEPDRELFILILAGAAAVGVVAAAVAKVIDAVNRGRPTVVVKKTLTPALDGHGKAIFDRNGKPVYNTIQEPVVVGATQPSSSTGLSVGTLFHFSMDDGKAAEQRSAGGAGNKKKPA